MRRLAPYSLALVSFAMLAPSLSSSGCTGSLAKPTHTATPTATSTPTPALFTILVYEFGWNPPTLTVSSGSTVTWQNTGVTQHRVVSGAGCLANPTPVLNSGAILSGGAWSFAFAVPGSYDYIDPACCTMGPGRVVVQ